MTPITYEETAQLLGVTVSSLRNAATRGVITRLPRTGQKQPLIREQVILFQGKPRLSLHVLNAQEKELWQQYAQAGEKKTAQGGASGADLAALGLLAGAGTLALMPVVLPGTGAGTPGMGVPQGNPFPVRLISLKIIP
jgi:hypothetical protein